MAKLQPIESIIKIVNKLHRLGSITVEKLMPKITSICFPNSKYFQRNFATELDFAW